MSTKRNVKLVLAYDGTERLGWQKTAMGPSIEGELERVLEQILQKQVKLQAASRTDAGVHAQGQVVNLFVEREVDGLQRSLNALLPKEIRVRSIEEVGQEFHPTLDAIGKEYHYSISMGPVQLPHHRHFAWHWPIALDVEKMREGAALLIGKRDFSSFTNRHKDEPDNRVRELRRISIVEDDLLCIEVEGDAFLYQMVRNLVGTLVYIGCGRLSAGVIPEILSGKRREAAGVTAPPHGLTLAKVDYLPSLTPELVP